MTFTRLVHHFLEKSAELFPEKNAFFISGRWHSYQDLNQRANKLSRLFQKSGVVKGDRVALFIENSMEYVVTYYAILKAGAVTVALNTESTIDDVEYIVRDCGVRVLVLSQNLFKRIKADLEERLGPLTKRQDSPLKKIMIWSRADSIDLEVQTVDVVALPGASEAEAPENPDVRMIDLDIASIVYTSGSTGKARGAVLTHLNIVSNTRSIVKYLELSSDDRIMVVLPFYYIYGKSLLNTHFSVGGSVVVDNRFLYPNVILQTITEQDVTGFSGVPSTFTILLSRSNVKSQEFKKLRYVTQAGGAMAPATQKAVAKAFSPAKLFIMYGATEASARLSYLDPSDLPRKWGSIGKAIPNIELFVADEKGTPIPAGEEGEIVARGSNIMSGYWNHPEETEKVLKNGLYYSGDIGKMDEEGFIYVVGRSKDMIKISGNRVSTKEIEEAICEYPNIQEVAVVGIPDDVLGEAPKAYVVLKPGCTEKIEEILPAFLQKHLALYKIPKVYETRDSLPKNESGKIQKLKLR